MPGEWCMVMGAAASALDNDASRACGGAVVTLRAAARPTQSSKHPALVLGDEIIDFRIDNDKVARARGWRPFSDRRGWQFEASRAWSYL